MSSKKGKTTDVRTSTETSARATRADSTSGDLTWLEEMVVRMNRGLSESGDKVLESKFAAGSNTALAVAEYEAAALAHLRGQGPLAAGTDDAIDRDVRDDILEGLGRLED